MKIFSFLKARSLRQQLIAITAITLAVGLAIITFFALQHNTDEMKQAELDKIDLISSILYKIIQEDMISGNAEIVVNWMDSIKKSGLRQIKSIRLIRSNGVEAFSDNTTIDAVNEYLGSDSFPKRPDSEPQGRAAGIDFNKIKKVVASAKKLAYEEKINGESIQTELVPLLKDERCEACHGYEKNLVRGILRISVSLAELQSNIKRNITWGIISFILVILAVSIIMNLLINSMVIKPVSKISFKITASARKQDRITFQQATSISEITASIEELNGSSKQVYEKTESLVKQSKEALMVAHEGQRAIDESISEMNLIKSKVEVIADEVLGLSENTNQIGAIISVVDDIASKTDMLAVNAAIEASKAGEQGKGFAVVASEVRSLADQSKKATEKITALIREIQTSVNSTVMATEEGAKKVDAGVSHVLEAGATINNGIETIRSTADAINEIAIASHQEMLANDYVAKAMGDINESMRESSFATKESFLVIQQLQKLIDRRSGGGSEPDSASKKNDSPDKRNEEDQS